MVLEKPIYKLAYPCWWKGAPVLVLDPTHLQFVGLYVFFLCCRVDILEVKQNHLFWEYNDIDEVGGDMTAVSQFQKTYFFPLWNKQTKMHEVVTKTLKTF